MSFTDRDERALRVASLDLGLVVAKMQLDDPTARRAWDAAEVLRTARLYRNFLTLHAVHPTGEPEVSPTAPIDEVWHNHILDTRAYERDCHAIFGGLLHHDPYAGRFDPPSPAADAARGLAGRVLALLQFGQTLD